MFFGRQVVTDREREEQHRQGQGRQLRPGHRPVVEAVFRPAGQEPAPDGEPGARQEQRQERGHRGGRAQAPGRGVLGQPGGRQQAARQRGAREGQVHRAEECPESRRRHGHFQAEAAPADGVGREPGREAEDQRGQHGHLQQQLGPEIGRGQGAPAHRQPAGIDEVAGQRQDRPEAGNPQRGPAVRQEQQRRRGAAAREPPAQPDGQAPRQDQQQEDQDRLRHDPIGQGVLEQPAGPQVAVAQGFPDRRE